MGWDDHLPPVAKADDPGPGGNAADALPRPRRRRGSLRDLMLLIAACSVVFLLGRQFVVSGSMADAVALVLGIGVLILAVGAWTLHRFDERMGVGWALIVVGYVVATAALFQLFAILSWPILAVVMVSIFARRRAIEQDALLGVMAIAAGRGMPLAPGIWAYSDQASGSARRWALSLAGLLEQGWTLADAVDAVPRSVSRPATVLIRVGSEVGALARALRTAVELRGARVSVIRPVGGRIAYLGWLLVMGQGIVGFLMYFILPKMRAIYMDFGLSLPWPTQTLVRATQFGAEYALLVVLLEGLAVAYLLWEVAGHGLGVGSPIARLSRRRHSALILRSLALAVDAGRPLAPTLATLAGHFPSRSIRRRLDAATRDVDEGIPWAEALYDRGLLTRAEAGVLEAAGRAGNLAWALREMASAGERRWGYRLQAWSQVAFFLALLGAGVVVLLIAVAYFLPLVHLITILSGTGE